MPSAHCERASEGLQSFADDPLLFEPETRYGYSTFGWILVSAAVEAAANEPFFTFMRTQIFQPLGMRDTTPDSVTEPIPDRATFYYPRFSGDPAYGPELATRVDYSCFAGAGAFLSTPSDLVRFGMAVSGGKLLKPATVSMLQTPQRLLRARRPTTASAGCSRPFRSRANPRAGEPCQPNLAGRLHLVHDISRTRDRRGRDVEHVVRGPEVDRAGHRAGLRESGETSRNKVTRPMLGAGLSRLPPRQSSLLFVLVGCRQKRLELDFCRVSTGPHDQRHSDRSAQSGQDDCRGGVVVASRCDGGRLGAGAPGDDRRSDGRAAAGVSLTAPLER